MAPSFGYLVERESHFICSGKATRINPNCGCGNQIIEIKGLVRTWGALQSLQNQSFDAIVMDMDFDKDMVKKYSELAKDSKKVSTRRQGLSKIFEYSALELNYMLGCDVESSS